MPLNRSHIVVGVVGLGAGAFLASLPFLVREAVDHIYDPYSRTQPDSVTHSCDGAKWTAVAALSPGSIVTVNVMVSDPERRDWQVRWRGGPVESARYDADNELAHAFAALGDLDDGAKRLVQVRPVNAKAWCVAEPSLR
jgi:hypothetical protein